MLSRGGPGGGERCRDHDAALDIDDFFRAAPPIPEQVAMPGETRTATVAKRPR